MEEKFETRMVRAAQEARKSQTSAEKALWAMLRGNRCGGLYFRRQAIMDSFRVDFFCAAVRLSIEVDGSIHDTMHVQLRDTERQAILEQEHGITFLRFTNAAVLNHPQETLQTVTFMVQHLRDKSYTHPPQG